MSSASRPTAIGTNYWLKAPVHFGNINPRPTPDILFSLLYASNAPWNESQYKSEKFDKP